jgi:hypothetical protein
MAGIYMMTTVPNGTLAITGNTIANMTNNIRYTYTSAGAVPLFGMLTGNAELNISNNTIHDLTVDYYANSMTVNILTGSAVAGIILSSNEAGQEATISGNEIYNCNVTNPTNGNGHVSCNGIQLMTNVGMTTVSGNFIHNLNVNSPASYSQVNGIQNYTSECYYYNNIISLGNEVTTSPGVGGIYDFSTGGYPTGRRAYYNTINISGVAPATTGNSYAFYSSLNQTRK